MFDKLNETFSCLLDNISLFFKDRLEVLLLIFGLFFIIAAWRNWNMIFEPPYNSIKNPIGFFFGRTGFRISLMASGVFIVLICIFIIYARILK